LSAILTKLTDYVFLTYCNILWKFSQDRITISYSCHRNNQKQVNILYDHHAVGQTVQDIKMKFLHNIAET